MKFSPIVRQFEPVTAGARVMSADGAYGTVERIRQQTDKRVLVAWDSGSRHWWHEASLLVVNPQQ
jgi:hypothetical protein